MISEHQNQRAGTARVARVLRVALVSVLCVSAPAFAQDGPPGITAPTVFPPFNRNAPACTAPPGLQKVLAFAQDNEREFMQGVSRGLAAPPRRTAGSTIAWRSPTTTAPG